jgi:hypothetical protein
VPQDNTKTLSVLTWDLIHKVASVAIISLGVPVLGIGITMWSDVRQLNAAVGPDSQHEAAHGKFTSFMGGGERFTVSDSVNLKMEIKEWVDRRFPPPWLQTDLAEIKKLAREQGEELKAMRSDVDKVLRGNK